MMGRRKRKQDLSQEIRGNGGLPYMRMNNRREFLQAGAIAAAPVFLARGLEVNDRIRVGIAGIRNRGFLLASTLHGMTAENVEVAAFCDVDAEPLAARAAQFEKLSGRKPAVYGDMRKMLEDRSIDVV